jgi:hypothetical protein
MNVLHFRPRPDLDEIVVDILATLAAARNTDIEVICKKFRDGHSHLRPSDLVAAFALTHRVVSVFERYLAKASDENSGGAA